MTVAVPSAARQRQALLVIALAEVLVMSPWFAAAAAGPDLGREWSLSAGDLGLLTVATQLGFVAGALALAVTGIGDLVASHRLLVVAALAVAASNAALPLAGGDLRVAFVIRLLLGVALAAFYPTGMRVMASWFDGGRGLAMGAVVGALTLGTASPHLLAGLGTGLDWRSVLALTTLSALGGALLAAAVIREGPFDARAHRFDARAAVRGLCDPALRLVNLAYVGHMWEVYGMWAWLPAFLAASFAAAGLDAPTVASIVAALAIAAGAIGCIASGALGDRLGRTAVTAAAMAVSAVSCVAIGLLFGSTPIVVGAVALVWGVAVIADSPQFSAAVTELAPPERVGGSLAMQMALGYLVSAVSIRLVPALVDTAGWPGAFGVLAIGPAVGVVAMLRLRSRPEARRMAQGRR